MPDEHAPFLHEHPEHVESVRLAGPSVAVDPRLRALGQLALLAVIHGFDRITEIIRTARFDFHERDEVVLLSDEVDVAPPRPKTARENLPPGLLEVTRGDAFAKFAEVVGRFGHTRMVRMGNAECVIKRTATRGE